MMMDGGTCGHRDGRLVVVGSTAEVVERRILETLTTSRAPLDLA
jgi:hypothetical protein